MKRQDDPSLMPAVGGGTVASIFAPGRNCCTVARAHRVGLLVDGEDYFRNFWRAAERAQRSINILAWDFNSNTRLRFDRPTEADAPQQLGDFLNWLARRRRELRINILEWDYPMVFGTDRELPLDLGLGWRPHRHINLAFDDTHPVAGSHHQKVVVIDDALAFVGGLDLTVRRWDTTGHYADDPRRTCDGKVYPPFHDVMMAVDGEAALALGNVVRARWRAATGHKLPAAPRPPLPSPWPAGLPVRLSDVDIAIARTLPERGEEPPVTEVEQLYLDMIAAARHRIYIENQYFTVGGIGEALAARLEEADGPEIVVVVRLFSHGWLEEHTMHVLRNRLVQRLQAADRHGRFHAYFPHVDGLPEKICIDLHSKLMIVDDTMLRVGSANLCNRSMGMDSECDVALEARGDARVSATIAAFRDELMAEHLGTTPAEVSAAVRTRGTLAGAIDALSGAARTLKCLECKVDLSDAMIDFARVGDPEKPVSLERIFEEFAPESGPPENGKKAAEPVDEEIAGNPAVRQIAARIIGAIVVLLALTAVWRYTPLSQWSNAERISEWAREFADRPWAPFLILFVYTPACLLMFPRPLITLAAVIAFGPLAGFGLAISGILLAALFTYIAGLRMSPQTVQNLAGKKLRDIAETLRRRGLIAVTALRLVPLAPFAIEGLVAAAIGIRVGTFLLGTLIGMLPGTLATTVFGDQLTAALSDPSRINYGLLAAAVALVVLLTLAVRRWLVNQHHRLHDMPHAETQRRAG